MDFFRRIIKRLWSCVMIALLTAFASFVTSVGATPTPPHQRLAWDQENATEQGVAGWFVYYALESVPEPREYTDVQRVDVGMLSETPQEQCPMPNPSSCRIVTFLDLSVPSQGSLCFRVTAYDGAGNESGFSNEACGFFGLPLPQNTRTGQ